MTRQPLWVILCHLPEKGRKCIEEIVEEMKEGQGRKRNRNESKETEEKKIPLYPLRKIPDTFAKPKHPRMSQGNEI